MGRRPGKLVECQDGRIGRTYNDEAPVNGKICVHLFPAAVTRAINAKTQAEASKPVGKVGPPEKRLCDPATLKVFGYAD